MRRLLPLWRLLRVCSLPRNLLAAHVRAYGQLAGLELDQAVALWRRRALLQATGLGAALAATGLAGVALMLWAVVPPAQVHAPWALWAVPLLPAVLALGCLWAGRARAQAPAFAGVRRQLAADLALLRQARGGPAAAPDAAVAAP
jgi:uncharacterized membrane protein YqjE